MQAYERQRVVEIEGDEVTFRLRPPEMDVPPPRDVAPKELRRGRALIAKAAGWEGVLEHPASREDVDEYPRGELVRLYERARSG